MELNWDLGTGLGLTISMALGFDKQIDSNNSNGDNKVTGYPYVQLYLDLSLYRQIYCCYIWIKVLSFSKCSASRILES